MRNFNTNSLRNGWTSYWNKLILMCVVCVLAIMNWACDSNDSAAGGYVWGPRVRLPCNCQLAERPLGQHLLASLSLSQQSFIMWCYGCSRAPSPPPPPPKWAKDYEETRGRKFLPKWKVLHDEIKKIWMVITTWDTRGLAHFWCRAVTCFPILIKKGSDLF